MRSLNNSNGEMVVVVVVVKGREGKMQGREDWEEQGEKSDNYHQAE